jgi:hypothetical protein
MRASRWHLAFGLSLLAASAASLAGEPDGQLEADWLLQLGRRARGAEARSPAGVTTVEDAAGAVDGVKDGKWGFHTENEAAPWWQVDLGRSEAIGRVVLYNRCDPGMAARASRLVLLLSDDGKEWREVYRHDGAVFLGFTDKKPLSVPLAGRKARFVRLQLPGTSYFHLDEVEVYGQDDLRQNLALGKAADQSSVSQWSARHGPPREPSSFPIAETIDRGRRLAGDLRTRGVDTRPFEQELNEVEAALKQTPPDKRRELYLRACRAVRRLAFANPLLDFDRLLITKRVPGSYSHMSDQYYGWWSRPGGGIHVLEGLRSGRPKLRCLTEGFEPGSFLRPDVSYDARKILSAYCKHYGHVSGLGDKVTKSRIPEDAFYHVYEMNADGSGVRRLTRGRYDDFDARYLPGGDIVFLSTRRGQFFQCGRSSAMATLQADLPDSYVRCGGGSSRPVAIYTLHVMDADGGSLRAISAFENFEWTPSVAADGRILFARWDYVDRHNNAFMSLWSTNPNGTNPQGVYGNFSRRPHCVFEARSVPNSNKIIFTASAHHAITGGSLVLLDPDVAQDGFAPLTRLTPEVCFPEIEGWPSTYYANPYPLSEKYHLVAWSPNPLRSEGGSNPGNSLGVYLFDVFGNLELIHRDPAISTMYPMPLRPRRLPPIASDPTDRRGPEGQEGRLLLADVYQGLPGVERGSVKRLRIVGVPAKVQPQMNQPSIGVTSEDPGKCVLGTVPVEPDGSAYFRMPAGVNVFFQALDAHGRAVQTMRTITYVQPGQTLSCIGCHEPRSTAPSGRPLAMLRGASKITPGPDGTWPLRFDRLVQPVLDGHCVRCHKPGGEPKAVARLDLTAEKSYPSLLAYGKLNNTVHFRYAAGQSRVNDCIALASPLPGMFLGDKPHQKVRLDADAVERLVTWLDTYAQRLGSFSDEQERRLRELRRAWAPMLAERPGAAAPPAPSPHTGAGREGAR